MFSYYGSKSKIVKKYPRPRLDRIVEPFAGSARYALEYFDREVLLIDKYDRIVAIWHWLQAASEKDIFGLPDKPADLTNFTGLSSAEADFLGFNWQAGNQYPGIKCGTFQSSDPERWQAYKKRVAKSLHKIRHWHIQLGEYADAPDIPSTWFIDSPYQFGGEKYKWGTRHLDFSQLREWILTCQGQVIVCENSKADWMDFSPLCNNQGAQKTNTTECIWTNAYSITDRPKTHQLALAI